MFVVVVGIAGAITLLCVFAVYLVLAPIIVICAVIGWVLQRRTRALYRAHPGLRAEVAEQLRNDSTVY